MVHTNNRVHYIFKNGYNNIVGLPILFIFWDNQRCGSRKEAEVIEEVEAEFVREEEALKVQEAEVVECKKWQYAGSRRTSSMPHN